MQEYIRTLKNGLTVILIDTEAFPSLTTLLLVGAGSRYENTKNNGIAHFFEHMAFKGSKRFPDSFTIASTIEGAGGVFNAFTSKDHTGYWIKSTVTHFSTVVDVLSDMIIHPILAEEEIEREKGVITEEINMYEDMPQRKVGEVFESLLYSGHPLGYDIAGKKETVSHFTSLTFKQYIGALYHPANSVLVVAGGLEKTKNEKLKIKNYLEIIESKFGHWTNGKKANFKRIEENQKKPQIHLVHKKTEQVHFCVGFRAFSFFDKRKYALSVLMVMLGGGMSSRLFIEVRERRGLCYYVGTSRELYHDAGTLVTQAGVSVNENKVKQALSIILKEHVDITRGIIRAGELERAKELIKGRFILSFEDSSHVASFYGTQKILENDIQNPQSMIQAIEKVTKDDVVSVASDIIRNERLNMTMIGPFDKKEIFESVVSV
ncbi:MAG TPA: pitrilysin family protein [Patescibacteria group bacterium]|nr:pitrilysin family protein [Patescibacteria group bacterium]